MRFQPLGHGLDAHVASHSPALVPVILNSTLPLPHMKAPQHYTYTYALCICHRAFVFVASAVLSETGALESGSNTCSTTRRPLT